MWAVYCHSWFWGGWQLHDTYETKEIAQAECDELNSEDEHNDDFEHDDFVVKEVTINSNGQIEPIDTDYWRW